MLAKDVMTSPAATVMPETEVQAIAKLLLERRISAVPVVDEKHRMLGIVSEGDLLRRAETDTERHRSWWLALLSDAKADAAEYIKTHGRRAAEVMTTDVITVDDDASLQEIAEILEEHRIKRVPVMRSGHLAGIVSRANLLQALAAGPARRSPAPLDDQAIRTAILEALREKAGVPTDFVNIVVSRGIVDLWGVAASEDIKHAVRVAAESVRGISEVRDHVGVMPPVVRAVIGAE